MFHFFISKQQKRDVDYTRNRVSSKFKTIFINNNSIELLKQFDVMLKTNNTIFLEHGTVSFILSKINFNLPYSVIL